MRTKLLRKMRKEAHDMFLITPTPNGVFDVQYQVEDRITHNVSWQVLYPNKTLPDAQQLADEARRKAFYQMVYNATYHRKVQRFNAY